ncbi:RCC1/BLIP-II, partial [Gymnopus androsaceus JB14]
LYGFGSGGRLGVTQHTQYALRPLANARLKVISIALGQDHTLALTESGEVYSWGLNRVAQLGYNIDDGSAAAQVFSLNEPLEFIPHANPTLSSNGEQIQLIPRRVYGPLKKEFVLGVAASKCASACWVRDGFDGAGGGGNIYTWGLNDGQLGYDRTTTGTSTQVQVLPRKVTKITRPVVQIALGESAMACFLGGAGGLGGGWKGDFLVVWGDRVGWVR